MARPRRLEPAGVPLHVVQRGNNRAACFFNDIDRRFYLKCLGDAAVRRRCAIHAYVLMTNHVHLLLTPEREGGASLMLQDLGRKYVQVMNKAHKRTGTLWEGRFKSSVIDSEKYLLTCHRYIELNPVRAGIVARPSNYFWTSHRHYAGATVDPLITEHRIYTELGLAGADRRRKFLQLFDEPIDDVVLGELRSSVNRGWALGSDAFLDRMEDILGHSIRPPRRGRPKKELGPAQPKLDAQREMLF